MLFPPLYPILDPDLLSAPLLPLAESLANAGVEIIQLRDKRSSPGKIAARAKAVIGRLSPLHVRVIVNDRPDIAAVTGAGGVHVGQDDLPVEDARKVCAAPLWVGVSTHNIEQFREACATSADYIAVGPIFATGSKRNPDPVVGLELIREARALTRKPIVAIGGITWESAADVYRAGADSIAVIRDLILARDPAARAREYLEIARRCSA